MSLNSSLNSKSYILNSRRRGQALVEVLVAVSVLTVGFLGIVTLLSRALALNRVVADNYTGTYLAAEGVEIAKNIIDGNAVQGGWLSGIREGTYEVDYTKTSLTVPFTEGHVLSLEPQSHTYRYDGTIPTPFVRQVQIRFVGNGSREVQVNSKVSWVTRGGGTSDINLEDHFFNWR
jgi:hypothetical protein